MIDIKHLRENPELYKENAKRKFKLEADNLRSERNKVSEEINQAKKNGKKADSLIRKAKEIPKKLAKTENDEKETYEKLKEGILKIPNIISKRVPIGKDENQNVEGEKFGKIDKKNFG